MKTGYQLIGPISQLVTLSGLPDRGAIGDEAIRPLENGAVLLKGNKVYKTGTYTDLKKEADQLGAEHHPLKENFVCLPGFIDAHTHICFAGSRANDYAMRNSGKTYLEISQAGGGIWDTVQQTRKASLEQLTRLTIERADRLLHEGITTIEVKSGYGLDLENELKMLRAIKKADSEAGADLIATCLAAHTLPRDISETRAVYLKTMADELFPVLLKEKLCTRMDAFIEQGAFSAEDIHPYFTKAKQEGFSVTVHADQFSSGGSAVAVEFDAVSADHLEASTDQDIALLAQSNVIAVALPGASLGLGCGFTPARKMLDAGLSLAIASDWNPGSAPMGDLLCQAAILGAFEKLSNAEVLSGITFRAAHALNLYDRGKLESDFIADFILFPATDYKEVLYHQGKLKPVQVWKNGALIHSSI